MRWIIASALLLGGCRSAGVSPGAAPAAGQEQTASVGTGTNLAGKRLVYPWSVVAGGVDSPMAMRAAVEADPVVAEHYAGLNPGAFRAERLATKLQGYVSYRIRDKVYWTRRMVTLQAGETVLSDGHTLLRGRCGNRISETPREPVAALAIEPPEIAMDVPVQAFQLQLGPEFPVETAVEAGSFENPLRMGENKEAMSVLPPPAARESMPPVWVTGGSSAPGFGVISGGGTGAATSPGAETPPRGVLSSPEASPSPPLEITPPMVLISLLSMSEKAGLPPPPLPPPPGDGWDAPHPSGYPPGSPPVWQPPSVTYPPGGNPPPLWQPPSGPPPGGPPTHNTPGGPPPSGAPPSGPPPAVPPTSGPPPTTPPGGPPPSWPPPAGPPPVALPPPPPTDTPTVTSIPEPGAWLLFVLGVIGITLGKIRRKS